MASFSGGHPLTWYVLWNLAGFLGAFLVNSFVEWFAHRFILHSRAIVRFAYELHDVRHHTLFGADASYHAQTEEVKEHVAFNWRDYVMFLAVTTPIWVLAEWLSGRSVLFGGVAATLVGLQLFNSLHWRYHVPSDTWFQRTWAFRYLKEHHRLHHRDRRRNLNVSFFPIADFCLGTLIPRNRP